MAHAELEQLNPTSDVVATKALCRAAERLGLNQAELGRVVGLSAASISRMYAGGFVLPLDRKEGELALLLLRVFRSLDTIVGGSPEALRRWFHAPNAHLGGVPAQLVERTEGLARVAEYLDAMRGSL